MLGQLAAFIAAVMGDALAYELMLLVVFGLGLTIRRNIRRGLRWFHQQQTEPADRLQAALWKLLRGSS